MINVPFSLGASVILAYVLAVGIFLLGLCRAAARAARLSEEAKPMINLTTSAPLAGIPEQIGTATL